MLGTSGRDLLQTTRLADPVKPPLGRREDLICRKRLCTSKFLVQFPTPCSQMSRRSVLPIPMQEAQIELGNNKLFAVGDPLSENATGGEIDV